MRVLFIHDHVFSENNGVVYSTGGLPSAVWERYLIGNNKLKVFGRKSLTLGNIKSSKKDVEFFFSKHYHSPIDFFFNKTNITIELTALIKKSDSIIIRLPSFLGLIAQGICKELDKPYAIEVVGNAFDALYHYGNIQGKLIAHIIHRKTYKAIKQSKHTIYVTEKYLQNIYPNINYTSYASNVHISNDTSENVLIKRLAKTESLDIKKQIHCGTIGNLEVKYKGYEIMFKAIKYLKVKYNMNILYKIAGGGDSSYLEKLVLKYDISNNVTFVGLLNRSEIFDFIDSLDIYSHPALLEGLPRSVVEVMSRACPAVTSNVGGIPELIDNEFMHNPKDYKKLAHDINKLIFSPEKIKEQSERNFEKAKKYSGDILSKQRKIFWDKFFNYVNNNF